MLISISLSVSFLLDKQINKLKSTLNTYTSLFVSQIWQMTPT